MDDGQQRRLNSHNSFNQKVSILQKEHRNSCGGVLPNIKKKSLSQVGVNRILNMKRQGLDVRDRIERKVDGDVQEEYSSIKKFIRMKQEAYDKEVGKYNLQMISKKILQNQRKNFNKKQQEKIKNSLEDFLEAKVAPSQARSETLRKNIKTSNRPRYQMSEAECVNERSAYKSI